MPRIAYECLGVPLRCLWFEQHASAHHGLWFEQHASAHHGAFGLSRYAFVRFVEVAGATAALKALHGKSFCGSALSVRYKRRLRKKRPVADGLEALPRAPRVEGAGEALPRAPRVDGAGEEEGRPWRLNQWRRVLHDSECDREKFIDNQLINK